MLGHLDDELGFGVVGRLFGFHEAFDHLVVELLAFAGQDAELAAEAVFEAIQGRTLFPFGGDGSCGFERVQAICFDLGIGGHEDFLSFRTGKAALASAWLEARFC